MRRSVNDANRTATTYSLRTSMMSLRSIFAMVGLMLVFVALAASTGCQKQADQKGEPAAGTKLVTVDVTGMT
jgi:hypothetical protein